MPESEIHHLFEMLLIQQNHGKCVDKPECAQSQIRKMQNKWPGL